MKAAACRSPNSIRKTKSTLYGTWVSVLFPKFWEKLLLNAKFLRYWTIGCWVMAKNDFQCSVCPPSWILKNNVWSRDCHRVPSVLLCTKFHQNRIIFSWRYGDFTICNMAAVRHADFSKFWFCVTWPLFPCAKFYWYRTIGWWVMDKKDL